MAAIYSNGGNRWNILGFNFTKRDALSSLYKISMDLSHAKTAFCLTKPYIDVFLGSRIHAHEQISLVQQLTWPALDQSFLARKNCQLLPSTHEQIKLVKGNLSVCMGLHI
jgi:hypothetical protein